MDKEKVLYLYDLDFSGKYGGAVEEKKNFECLSSDFDVEKIKIDFKKRSRFEKLKDLFFSKVPFLFNRKQVESIKEQIKKSDAKVMFVETSKMGYLVKFAKKCGKKVIVFMHNYEVALYYRIKAHKGFGFLFLHNLKKQEKESLKYADLILYLNNRDKEEIEQAYKLKNKNYKFCPVALKDVLSNDDIEYMRNKKRGKKGLFLGAYFTPNNNGLKWFIDNVYNHIEIEEFIVVGNKFEQHRDEFRAKNLKIVGTVDETKPYIMDADFVVCPIFEGSGMKVKTCELLMYGKKIFASDEACIGYQIDNRQISVCNNADEYIREINNYLNSDESSYCDKARNLFLDMYEYNKSKDILKSSVSYVLNLEE